MTLSISTIRKNLFKLIVSLALIPNLAFGDCPNAIRLNPGDKVTDCERICLSVAYDLQVRKDLVEGEYNVKIIDEQKKVITAKDLVIKDTEGQRDLFKAESIRQQERYESERSKSSWNFWVGLGVGIVTVAISAYVIKQVAR
jgi:hypothetical protein